MKKKVLFSLSIFMLVIAVCTQGAFAIVIEDFETGVLGSDWVYKGSGSSTPVIGSASAHDGTYGIKDPGWFYHSGALGQVSEGDVISAWFRPGQSTSGGRFYLGFGADDSGTHSFISASNTNDIRFQDNPSYSHTQLNVSPQTWTLDSWYLMEIVWQTGGSAIGNLYGSDGTTLLNSVTQTGLTRTTGGVAIRSFDNFDIDTIEVNKATNPVPEPATMLLLGSGLLGLFGFKRKKIKS